MDTNTETLSTALREALEGLKKLSVVIEAAVNALRDKDEELRIVHDTNNRLTEENARLRERGSSLSDELYQARRETRDALQAKDAAESKVGSLTSQLEQANDECKRLREMILNVAVAIEAAGLTPSKALREEVASVRPTSSPTPVSAVTGSVSTGAGGDGSGGAGDSRNTGAGGGQSEPVYADEPFWQGQPREPNGRFLSPRRHS